MNKLKLSDSSPTNFIFISIGFQTILSFSKVDYTYSLDFTSPISPLIALFSSIVRIENYK